MNIERCVSVPDVLAIGWERGSDELDGPDGSGDERVDGGVYSIFHCLSSSLSLKAEGDGAKRHELLSESSPQLTHAKSVVSTDCLMISSCRRWKALRPSPYRVGIWIPNKPRRQYASSSTRVVLRSPNHDIRWEMLVVVWLSSRRSTSAGIPVVSSRSSA